jgi:hypothetical protein
MWAGVIEIADAGQNFMSDGAEAGAGVAEQSASAPVAAASGFQPTQLAGAAMPGGLASGFQPAGLQPMSLPNLQTAALLGGVQLPQIPKIPQIPKPLSFIEKIKKAAETILQKIASLFQSGNDIRSSAQADNRAKANNSASQAKNKVESKKKEAESSKIIERVEGSNEAFQGQEVMYKATVRNKDGIVKDCSDVRWAIKADGKELKESDIKKDNDIRIEKDKITIKIKDAWAGKEIIVMPYLKSPDEELAVRTVVNKMFPMLILQGKRRKGKNRENTDIADDLLYKDYAMDERGYEKLKNQIIRFLISENIEKTENAARKVTEKKVNKIKEYCKKSDAKLFEIFNDEVKWYTIGGLKTIVQQMVKRVEENTGDEFTNQYLTDTVKQHNNSQRFIFETKREIIDLLKKKEYREELERLRIKDKSGIIFDRLVDIGTPNPKFSKIGNIINGLKIAINDVWAYQVYITDYAVEGNRFTANLNFIYWDHFGLDYPDLAKYDNDIFYSWFVLQHFKGYRPFITKISIDEVCSGNF